MYDTYSFIESRNALTSPSSPGVCGHLQAITVTIGTERGPLTDFDEISTAANMANDALDRQVRARDATSRAPPRPTPQPARPGPRHASAIRARFSWPDVARRGRRAARHQGGMVRHAAGPVAPSGAAPRHLVRALRRLPFLSYAIRIAFK